MEWCSSYRCIEQGVKKLDTSVNNNQFYRNFVVIGDNAGEKLVSYVNITLVSYVDSSTRERRSSDMDWTREKIYTSLITFANIMSYFCFVFHHTASAFSVKLFLKYYIRDKV